jgi:ribosomal protein S6--L-glutamate ligase
MNSKRNKSILVASESQALYTTQRLLSEAKKLKYEAKWFNPYDSLLALKQHHSTNSFNGLYFLRTSGVRYDDFDLTVAGHFEDQGIRITNSLPSLLPFRSKDTQALFFRRHKIKTIPSVLYRGALNENYWKEIDLISPDQQYILKMVRGNQGTGVNLVSGSQSLKSLLETFHALKDQKFLIQPFIAHKKEWRAFVIHGEIYGVIERTINADDFRGNSKRSSGKFLKKCPPSLSKEILSAAKLSGLDYCGIDVMETKEGFIFLEINAVPGFEQMEELSGINIARELIARTI